MADFRIDQRAVDNPGRVRCVKCERDVELPRTEAWLTVAGVSLGPPQLVSFRCPACRRRIYLDARNEKDRERDEANDAFADMDNE